MHIGGGPRLLVQHMSFRPQQTDVSIPAPAKLLPMPRTHQPYAPEYPVLSLPSIPSIAVLPFTNLSGDLQQEYFSDGTTDDLFTDLSPDRRRFPSWSIAQPMANE